MTKSPSHFSDAPSEIEIVIHLGAHKTATSYLQCLLEKNDDFLMKRGICAIKTRKLRENLQQVSTKNSLLNFIPMVRNWHAKRVYQNCLQEAETASCSRLIISEENLLGSLSRLVKNGFFYYEINQKLKPVFQGFNNRPVTALLALRSYDSFLASACSQNIRRFGYWKIDDKTKLRLLSLSRGWIEVIEDILRSLPAGSQLRVWCFEDFIVNDETVITELVGAENSKHLVSLESKPVPRLTIRAMERLEELHKNGMSTGPKDVKRVAKNFPKDKGFKPYSPWTDEEQSVLAKRYNKDLALIRERWPDIMITA